MLHVSCRQSVCFICVKFKREHCVYAKTSSNDVCPVSVLGCGHCKKAKPEFMDAAKHDADNNKARNIVILCEVAKSVFLGGIKLC